MEFGDYTKSAVVTLSGLILFFIGILLPLMKGFELIPLFALFLLTVLVSFYNRTPLGGFFYGLFTSISFLIGNLLSIVFIEYSLIISESSIADQGFSLFLNLISDYVPEFISFIIAFASLGLFFGLFGYVYHQTSTETLLNPPLHYRDYWSNIHSLGKSEKREYSELDRRFGTGSLKIKGIWKKIISGIKLPKPEIVFVLNEKQKSKDMSRGDLYDLSSGQMLGNNLVNPNHLISKYRPYVLKIPEYSTNTKGIRRIVFEKLLENFLGKILKPKILLPIFGILSIIFVFSINFNKESSSILYFGNELPVIIAICFSIFTLIFVWRWGIRSRKLFQKRPDERILILIVYIVLGLLYGFFYEMVLNFPSDTAGWVDAWFVWTRWFLGLSIILGIGYILIHREVEIINTYFYDNSGSESKILKHPVYKNAKDEPYWIKAKEIKSYWVIRFMYFWRYELAKVPHSDWERIELWFDAEKGALKWVVSDYHYRELWYEVKDELSSLYVSFFVNFHTPIPILSEQDVSTILEAINKDNKNLLKIFIKGRSEEIIKNIKMLLDKKYWQELHPPKWISNFGLKNVTADFSSKIPWTFWRYPFGLEHPEIYLEKPAAVEEEEPQNNKKRKG